MTSGGAWRIEVRHTTGYAYPKTVWASYNEARLTPLSTPTQVTIASRVDVRPATRVRRYWDYWGALVHTFDIHVPHDALEVVGTSTVETGGRQAAPTSSADDASWSHLDGPSFLDDHYETLCASTATMPDDRVLDVARELRAAAATPAAGLDLAVAWVRDELDYERGATSATTSAVEALAAGRGVCQDFVHVTIAVLRSMGIPARYVSGYFLPKRDAAVDETVLGESHAWAEAWVGGWRPVDPTNPVDVAHRHVVVARGRDYRDVTPLKGVYSGSSSSTQTVRVEMTRRA